MYVCLCNAISESMVEDAIEDGARAEEAVYGHHGCEEVCGRCKPMMRAMIAERCGEHLLIPVEHGPERPNPPLSLDAPRWYPAAAE